MRDDVVELQVLFRTAAHTAALVPHPGEISDRLGDAFATRIRYADLPRADLTKTVQSGILTPSAVPDQQLDVLGIEFVVGPEEILVPSPPQVLPALSAQIRDTAITLISNKILTNLHKYHR